MKNAATALLCAALLSCSSGAAPAPTDPGANPPSADAWVFCANEYSGCDFAGSGLRDVRFGLNGTYTVKEFYGSLPYCKAEEFGLPSSAGGSGAARCEYAGSYKTTVLTNPMPGMSGIGATVTVPLGHRGYAGQRIQSTADRGVPSDIGAFRIPCAPSHFAFDDPIVAPGQPGAAHLHMFFGNTLTDASSTAASIASTGNSTCAGGTANRTAYWVPALLDGNGVPVLPDFQIFYYKTGYGGVAPADVRPMPPGLRMISGDKNATAAQSMAYWGCNEVYIGHFGSIREVLADPRCGPGKHLVMSVEFPQCWDGANLDAPDHKSHLAFASGGCPASHPVPLPVITFNIDFLIPASGTAGWHLSSDNYDYARLGGGFSVHGDWFNGWDPQVENTWITNCENRSIDCHAYLLGDGRTLF